jgi:hypothetical protein
MHIDRKLNLVIPKARPDGSTVYIYSMPITSQTYDQYWMVMSKALNSIYANGVAIMAPRIAHKALHDAAASMGRDEDSRRESVERVQQGLVNEMHRMTTIAVVGPSGWEQLPFQDALNKKALTATEADEVEGAITFFTLVSCLHLQSDAEALIDGAMEIWHAQTTFLSFTEYLASLPTSTKDDSSGVKTH